MRLSSFPFWLQLSVQANSQLTPPSNPSPRSRISALKTKSPAWWYDTWDVYQASSKSTATADTPIRQLQESCCFQASTFSS